MSNLQIGLIALVSVLLAVLFCVANQQYTNNKQKAEDAQTKITGEQYWAAVGAANKKQEAAKKKQRIAKESTGCVKGKIITWISMNDYKEHAGTVISVVNGGYKVSFYFLGHEAVTLVPQSQVTSCY